MLAAYTDSEQQKSSFVLMGANSLLTSSRESKADTNVSILSSNNEGALDSCSFANIFSEPTDSELMTFAENCESCGSVAYSGSESCGSVAYAGGESCGSVAAGGFSSGSSAGCGGCSYSC